MTKKTKLELTWPGKEDRPKLEPRILIENPDKSTHATARRSDADIFDNMLIKGDNLLALKALEADYAGKVKCIYIDPPYNTGSAFEFYDDGLEHSLWLSLMRDRIELLRNLLSNDGLMFVQIDDNEMAYLTVLMDELFGRENRVNVVAVKMSEASGVKMSHVDKKLPKLKEYVLIYRKEKTPKLTMENVPAGAWNDEYKRVLSVGAALGRELLTVPGTQRHLLAADLLKELADGFVCRGLLLLDNIELLFDRTLQLSPLDLLRRHAHARRVVAVWPGELQEGRLSYAATGHSEHQDYGIDGLVPFKIR